MYITYKEYREFGGPLDETTFNKFLYEAEKQVDSETFGRINEPSEAVKRCVAKITDLISFRDISSNKVSSFSHDGLSESYVVPNSLEIEAEIKKVIFVYLSLEKDEEGIPLLYRGVG